MLLLLVKSIWVEITIIVKKEINVISPRNRQIVINENYASQNISNVSK